MPAEMRPRRQPREEVTVQRVREAGGEALSDQGAGTGLMVRGRWAVALHSRSNRQSASAARTQQPAAAPSNKPKQAGRRLSARQLAWAVHLP